MLAELLAWYNVVFFAAGAVALLFTLLSAIAVTGGSNVDADADIDADIDVDVDADVAGDLDADFDADVDAEVDADAGHDAADGFGALLGFFGLGKVPFTLLIVIFGFAFSLSGLMANQTFITEPEHASAYFPISLGIASVVGLAALHWLSRLLARYLPTLATAVVPPKKLVGLRGQASLPVHERGGEVQVYDRFGTLHNRPCRVRAGAAAIPKGATVILVQYVPKAGFYYVSASR